MVSRGKVTLSGMQLRPLKPVSALVEVETNDNTRNVVVAATAEGLISQPPGSLLRILQLFHSAQAILRTFES